MPLWELLPGQVVALQFDYKLAGEDDRVAASLVEWNLEQRGVWPFLLQAYIILFLVLDSTTDEARG